MKIAFLFLLTVFLACFGTTTSVQLFNPPFTKSQIGSTFVIDSTLSEYDIWEFLKENPSELIVIEKLGPPDSVWVSDEEPYYVLYYFKKEIFDYNSIELDIVSRYVTGYEWD